MQKPLIPALLLTLLALFGCSKSDNLKVQNDTWVVSFYSHKVQGQTDNKDDTALFSNYSFEFNDDDAMVVRMPNGSTLDGKWRLDPSLASFGLDNPTAPIDIVIGDWQVVSQTDTEIKLGGKWDATSFVDQSILHFTKQ